MMRLAKIVATLGPASNSPEKISELIDAGVNVFRLNFSHGLHDVLTEVVATIRQISRDKNIPIAILGDLQGPKFRTGLLENHEPVLLQKGNTVRFTVETVPGTAECITTNTPQILEALTPGQDVLLDDGTMRIRVIERLGIHDLNCEIIAGGLLKEKKGINVPGLKMENVPALTPKDEIDAAFALKMEVDYLALSFVRSAQDITVLRNFMDEHLAPTQRPPLIIAKIEKPQALDEIDAIIQTADGIMVARGDLGVELLPENVPVIQKMLIRKANEAEKPIITATQMLESMIKVPVPTRAEVSDVANAVFDGSDALMLSAETAAGDYPVESVQMMVRIISESESHFGEWRQQSALSTLIDDMQSAPVFKFHQAIAQAACYAAIKAKTAAIVVLSYSGNMALRLSKRKPQCPIIALTPHQTVYQKLCLMRGVYPIKINAPETTEETLYEAEKAIEKQGILKIGDSVVFCAGQTHLNELTNLIKIYPFGDILAPDQSSPGQVSTEQRLPLDAPKSGTTQESLVKA